MAKFILKTIIFFVLCLFINSAQCVPSNSIYFMIPPNSPSITLPQHEVQSNINTQNNINIQNTNIENPPLNINNEIEQNSREFLPAHNNQDNSMSTFKNSSVNCPFPLNLANDIFLLINEYLPLKDSISHILINKLWKNVILNFLKSRIHTLNLSCIPINSENIENLLRLYTNSSCIQHLILKSSKSTAISQIKPFLNIFPILNKITVDLNLNIAPYTHNDVALTQQVNSAFMIDIASTPLNSLILSLPENALHEHDNLLNTLAIGNISELKYNTDYSQPSPLLFKHLKNLKIENINEIINNSGFINMLSNCHDIKSLHLQGIFNKLERFSCLLAKEQFSHLELLHIKGVFYEISELLSNAISDLKELKKINIHGKFSNLEYLAKAFIKLKHLTNIEINASTSTPTTGIQELMKSLLSSKGTLVEFTLQGHFSNKDIWNIVKNIKKFTSLKKLIIKAPNSLNDEENFTDIPQILFKFTEAHSLKSLYISKNKLTLDLDDETRLESFKKYLKQIK